MLDISSEKGKTVVVCMAGELDHHTSESARESLDNLIEDNSIKNMVVDLSELKFMDSSGIGVFIGRYKILSERAGKMVVFGLNNHISKIWEISGLYKIIAIYESLDASLHGVQEVE